MVKEKRILSYFIGWLVLGFIICFIGITKTYALVIDSSYLGQSANTNIGIESNSYKQANSYITVDQSNALNYYVVDICITSNFSISNVSNYSGNVSHYKTYTNLGSCNTTNYNGSLARIYFKVNQWADAGNGNYGITFSSRLNNTSNYYSDTRILNIYTSDEVDNTSELINNQTNELNNSINNSTNTITGSITETEDNINQNIDNMEQSIVDSNKETQDVIKDQFNSCRDSYNLLYTPYTVDNKLTDTAIRDDYFNTLNYYVTLQAGKTYTFGVETDGNYGGQTGSDTVEIIFLKGPNFTYFIPMGSNPFTFIPQETGDYYIRYDINQNTKTHSFWNFQVVEGSSIKKWEQAGVKVCTNKLDEQNETQKGIWATIKDLPNAFMDMLKGLFIPEDGYFENWFNSLKAFFEVKLGFLATPFTIIIDFINRYLNLNPSADIIINIPDITVPNFEDHVIVKETTFNWSQLLQSKESLNTLWQLYLSFVDVFLILNFINLCENKYNRIFGGDTSQYEYYTVEESYSINDSTGEATNHKLNERRTTRKKVV
mgnify:CR=1 FL=1